MRVGLVSCSSGKLDRAAPARELYTGDLFTLSRAWIEPKVDEWGILSAKHGLVMPDQVVEPYDLALAAQPEADRAAWAERTAEQLVARWGRDVVYLVVAGAEYRRALAGMPYVEDVITSWGAWRGEQGLRPAHVGIGTLKKYLAAGKAFGS